MNYFPEPCGLITVQLATGGFEQLQRCQRCGKPEINIKEQRYLRREKIDLGRCHCPRGVGA